MVKKKFKKYMSACFLYESVWFGALRWLCSRLGKFIFTKYY